MRPGSLDAEGMLDLLAFRQPLVLLGDGKMHAKGKQSGSFPCVAKGVPNQEGALTKTLHVEQPSLCDFLRV